MRLLRWFTFFTIIACLSLWSILYFLPKPPLLENIAFSKAIYDEQQQLLRLTLSDDEKYRLFTPFQRIPTSLIEATLLQEDQYFFQHFGVNPFSIIKATWQTYILKNRRVGASTITMQVARLRYKIASKKVSGKLMQIFYALRLETHYSKQEILEAYLNLAPYGGNVEGVAAASIIYFNKPIEKITFPQSLLLAIIPQNPTKRKPPYQELNHIRARLFDRWLAIHPEDKKYSSAMKLPISVRTTQNLPFIAPHFTNSILNSKKSGDIYTTLNIKMQTIIENRVKNYLARKHYLGVNNATVLLIDTENMQIKSLLGSADFFNSAIDGQVNGTDAKRSPGSTLKPFIYGLALDQGLIHPLTVLKDVPHRFGHYNPENFDKDFLGPITAQDALTLSRNIPAIYLANLLKFPNLYTLLEKSQVTQLKSESFYGLSLPLGGAELTPKELASLYAMLANKGIWRPLQMLQQHDSSKGITLLSPEASFLVLDMLKKTKRPQNLNSFFPVAWKTGTSSGFRDAWTVGIFGPYVLTVWIGNFDNTSNAEFIGKNIAAPLFFEIIEGLRQETGKLVEKNNSSEPLNLVQIDVCKASGLLPTAFCPDRTKTWFIPGKSPIKTDTIFREIAINPENGLRTCHINKDTEFKIYEFWPSDILKIFKKAGIARKTPPPFEKDCALSSNTSQSLFITSPQKELTYIIKAESSTHQPIPFTAITDADVATLYWFINDSFLGQTTPEKALLWTPIAGKYHVRVVDDHGLSDTISIAIAVDK